MFKRLKAWWFRGTKICDLCGLRVKDVEVPLHITSRGGTFVHPLHIIMSTKGRQIIDAHAADRKLNKGESL